MISFKYTNFDSKNVASLVFFGAGASRPFGIPTMQEMVTEFEKGLENKDKECYEFYSNIKNTLVEKYSEQNIYIESILSVLNGIVSEIKAKDLGYYAYYHIQDYSLSSLVKHHKFYPLHHL